MVLAYGAVVSKCVFYQGVGIIARTLCQLLVRLVEIHTVALCPGSNPGEVLGVCLAVREVDVVVQRVVLYFQAKHVKQVNIG